MNLFAFFYRIIMSIGASFLLVAVYLIKQTVSKDSIDFIEIAKIIGFLAVPTVMTGIAIFMSRWLSKDKFDPNNVSNIESVSHQFLPSYLSLTFVGISISGHVPLLISVYMTLFIFTFLSQSFYHNPFFFLFGYQFYRLTLKNGKKLLLLSKQKLAEPDDVNIPSVEKINDYFYIDRAVK